MKYIAFYFLFYITLVYEVRSDAIISLEFDRYENPKGTGDNGHCCDGKWGICQPNGCDHMFTICLDTPNSGTRVSGCAYGKATTEAINNQDSITFGARISNLPNPINFHVKGPLPTQLKLKVSVADKDMITYDFVELLQTIIPVSTDGISHVVIRQRTRLEARMRATCSNHYYGDRCDVYCAPPSGRDHHYCDPVTGQRICQPGYEHECGENRCSSYHCLHGGTCFVTSSGNPNCACLENFSGDHCQNSATVIHDCDDINRNPNNKGNNGVYDITPGGTAFPVYCEMSPDGEGWTVIQRRLDGSVDFNRNWTEYATGFGHIGADTEFWLGLENLHKITEQPNRNYKLRIDMQDHYGESRYAQYGQFSVDGAETAYRLHLADYSGTAGDGLQGDDELTSDGNAFSTYDRDNDKVSQFSCAQRYESGWWYAGCSRSNLNGVYLTQDRHRSHADCQRNEDRCVVWYGDRNPGSLRAVRLMILPY